MALVNMQVFEDYLQGSMNEVVDQKIDLFNQGTRGAITLTNARNEGSFHSEAFWSNIAGLARRRDANGSGAVSPVALAQEAHTGVKVAGGTPPISFDPSQLLWIQKSPEEAGVVIGEQLGVAIVQDQINTAIRCAVAAVQDAALINDASAGTMSMSDLVTGASAFSDRAANIVCWVMHGKVMHDLHLSNVNNSERLFTIGDINVMEDGYGRVLIMTDSPDFINVTPDPDQYSTLGLVSGAVSIEDNGDFFSNIETSNGDENIGRTFQAEYSFNAKLKGYSWDKANGGSSPADAALALPSNWDKVATSNKDTLGVKVITQ